MQLTDLAPKDAATYLADTIEVVLLRLPRKDRLARLAAIDKALERYRMETGVINGTAIQDPEMRRGTSQRESVRTRHALARGTASR